MTVGPKCEAVRLLADIAAPGDFRIDNQAGDHLYARANGAPYPPTGSHFTLKTGWEAGEPAAPPNVVAVGGGSQGVSKAQCAPVDSADAHSGKRMLGLSGTIDDPKYGFAYYKILEGPIDVASDTTLTYWLRPANDDSRHSGVDLIFTDGAALRDTGVKDTADVPVHPETPRGVVGQWTKIVIPLGQFAGRTIATVVFAYDQRDIGGGTFEAWMDDLSIEAPSASGPWQISLSPRGRDVRGGDGDQAPPAAGVEDPLLARRHLADREVAGVHEGDRAGQAGAVGTTLRRGASRRHGDEPRLLSPVRSHRQVRVSV